MIIRPVSEIDGESSIDTELLRLKEKLDTAELSHLTGEPTISLDEASRRLEDRYNRTGK